MPQTVTLDTKKLWAVDSRIDSLYIKGMLADKSLGISPTGIIHLDFVLSAVVGSDCDLLFSLYS